MGLLDMLGGGRPRGGMSPLTMAVLGVLAYRTMKGKGRLADLIGGAPNIEGSLGGAGGTLGSLVSGSALSEGLSALLNRFRINGYGDKAQSWISSSPNTPIAPHELQEALGPERMQWLMQQTGMPKDELLAGLSRTLPETVDRLTPEGRVPTNMEAQQVL